MHTAAEQMTILDRKKIGDASFKVSPLIFMTLKYMVVEH
jgi:hypothetical protein